MPGLAERVQVSKASVAYGPSNNPDRACGTCIMYHRGGSCDLVAGPIDPAATCNKWEERLPLATAAAEAYLSGWALTDAPYTKRIAAGLAAVVAAAGERTAHPGVLEATLLLGQLDGIWATVYARREQLLARHAKRVLAAWRTAVKGLDPATVVAVFRREAYLTAEAATKDPTKRWWQEVGAAAALGWLRAVYHADGYDALVAALADAIRSGMAEGEADALALAAARQGKTGFQIDKAFRAAYDRLASDHSADQKAADAATRLIDATAGDVGRRLASLAGDGSSADDMTSGVGDVIGVGNALQVNVQDLLWGAMAAAVLALITGASQAQPTTPPAPGEPPQPPQQPPGMGMVNWVTESGNPCQICLDIEAGSPYAPQDVPALPQHPRCQCEIYPATDIPDSYFSAYLLN